MIIGRRNFITKSSVYAMSRFHFGRPFVKRFALFYRTVVCLSCLSVCNVGVLWPNGLMDQDETWHGARHGPGHIVLDGDPAPPKGAQPHFRPMPVVAKRSPILATVEHLLLLKSIQSHSPGLYTPYKKPIYRYPQIFCHVDQMRVDAML